MYLTSLLMTIADEIVPSAPNLLAAGASLMIVWAWLPC